VIIRTVTANGGGAFTLIVPTGAVSVLKFTAGGFTPDSVTSSDFPVRAYLSADLTDSLDTIERTGAKKLLAIANTDFPSFPVSAGESLLVVIAWNGSAVIYFESADA
jgi:hypothetical protein